MRYYEGLFRRGMAWLEKEVARERRFRAACAAMQGRLAAKEDSYRETEHNAEEAWEAADALIAAGKVELEPSEDLRIDP